jgi:Tol biopolymer transport system component
MNLARRSSSVLASGAEVSAPSFVENAPVYSTKLKKESLPKTNSISNVSVLGIENTKIILNVNGSRMTLDPLGNGSYVWPALSPDKRQLAAYEMDRGAFVCDLRGTVISRLGRRDAPSWTRSGKWIVYMEDKDDGHKLLSSDIFAVSADGKTTMQLTSTSGVFELYPQCSPTENKIVCNTANGNIVILSYEERQ